MDRSAAEPGRPDFPYYAGTPVLLGGWQWLFVLASLALAFWLLTTPLLPHPQGVGLLLRPLLFCTVPLLALAWVAGPAWKALFRKVRGKDVMLMFGIAALNLLVTVLVALLVSSAIHSSANPAFGTLAQADDATRLTAFVAMVPQLLGEELFTLLPFLACLWLLHTKLKASRRTALVLAWVLSAVPFALVHLPTYGWNVLQCLVIIGTARLVLTLAYLLTRNLWVSTGAHVLNDWALFGFGLFATTAAG